MPITVKYFASLRDRMGRGGEDVSEHEARTVQEVWDRVSAGQPMPPNTLVAVNLEYVGRDHPVSGGDEVAFFPPVTGG
jgi:molybdopterin synthase sulfur carrier subunit